MSGLAFDPCAKCEEVMQPYLDRELDDSQMREAEAHLDTCSYCRRRYRFEVSLRRYDSQPYYPTMKYDPRARSLLVVGVHADRRLVQMRARDQGLRVIVVDPEQYVGPDGRRIAYPVEAPQDADFFARCTAQEGFTRLHRALEGQSPA